MGRKPISIAVKAGRRQADDVGEIRVRRDAGDHRDALGQSRRSCREEGEAPADRDAGKSDPPSQGFGRVTGRGHQLDRRPQRRRCELTSPDARQVGNVDEKARPCQSETKPADDRVVATVRCSAVDEHQRGPRRPGPRRENAGGDFADDSSPRSTVPSRAARPPGFRGREASSPRWRHRAHGLAAALRPPASRSRQDEERDRRVLADDREPRRARERPRDSRRHAARGRDAPAHTRLRRAYTRLHRPRAEQSRGRRFGRRFAGRRSPRSSPAGRRVRRRARSADRANTNGRRSRGARLPKRPRASEPAIQDGGPESRTA